MQTKIIKIRTINMDLLVGLGTATSRAGRPFSADLPYLTLSQHCEFAFGRTTTAVAETVMSSVRAYVQEISINSIRKQAALVMRGNFFLVWLPIFLLLFLIFSPRFDAAKFARPDF